ncbi:methyltransferase family protein [Larkinella arboricola]|uniref:Methyltransferase family protein n=1 Tax=Larkinella arboricola TaxID=643671 RepID=A0A327WNL2_LARAB|nr:class I SAM-dependent methyltransferase [Larkinella arboricola]RAJ93185.1 methyltransferase family protein [Larkinella arboricola]
MEPIRKPFQGVVNILRFNWHLYAWAGGLVILLWLVSPLLTSPYRVWFPLIAWLIVLGTLTSLLVSFYVYDRSNLYRFSWLNAVFDTPPSTLLTFHAGFDETSALLQQRFPQAHLQAFDFYDPQRHTEVSIQRARKVYAAYANTQSIQTSQVPLPDGVADGIFLVLAAHEIRHPAERIHFFGELRRVLKPAGKLIVVEHLRNPLNFLAYNIGFFHFLSESVWRTTFRKAALRLSRRSNIAHFITVFVLEKNDHAA